MKTFDIPKMSCGHCRAVVEKTIRALDPEALIRFDNDARRIQLNSWIGAEDVKAALTNAGYPTTECDVSV